ncbi:EpsG family protein [Flavobacterium gelidilacus]|uniref:EpsG family protein n=1 Tax=Flavobacterium gelidilacus TaxID=206041 RepID=UPI000403A82A|nr:EpsG family protein [Flavobacterium gelidilacus]
MSFDFIPLEYYTFIYYLIILIVVLNTFFQLQTAKFKSNKNGLLLVWFVIIYMGFRPISIAYFADMDTYAKYFENYQNGESILTDKDILFHYFMQWCSSFMSVNFFFLTCAFLYIFPLYLVCKKWFVKYWFYAFLLLIASFSFWGAGTNGIRNGIAGSIFLLAISREKRLWQIILLLISVSFHKTMLLPILGLIITQFYNKPKYLMWFWLFSIPLSLLGGGYWETLFASLGFEDDRFSYLTDDASIKNFSSIGFRWDFLLYSATAVYTGWYFIIKKKFVDNMYFIIFNIYVFANAFWILVIRANFSNRFAYLSWFMMALVIAYPFLKSNILRNQHKSFAKVLLLYFLFTFFMNVILSS